MSTPDILSTKLYIPHTRPDLVLRPRLIEQMNEGLVFAEKRLRIPGLEVGAQRV